MTRSRNIPGSNKAKSAARKVRLGQELRANLRRRKDQARARSGDPAVKTSASSDKSAKSE